MDKRKELILNTIIKEHVKTGAPVGSGVLAENYKLGISPATVRNEMAALEDEGFIIQPHTSAGRIPTEQAYRFYLGNLSVKGLKGSEKDDIEQALRKKDEPSLKTTAKIMARISDNTVFWAIHQHNLYYTGISNLFQQPEFREVGLIQNMSNIIDQLDEIIDKILKEEKMGVKVLLGQENPFGDFCSAILAKYKLGDNYGLFGILGPIRMNYEKNVALVKYVNEIISKK